MNNNQTLALPKPAKLTGNMQAISEWNGSGTSEGVDQDHAGSSFNGELPKGSIGTQKDFKMREFIPEKKNSDMTDVEDLSMSFRGDRYKLSQSFQRQQADSDGSESVSDMSSMSRSSKINPERLSYSQA